VEAELGAILITHRLCLDCIAHKMHQPREMIAARIHDLRAVVIIRPREMVCEGCRATAVTYAML
jgi:hypothetical protein